MKGRVLTLTVSGLPRPHILKFFRKAVRDACEREVAQKNAFDGDPISVVVTVKVITGRFVPNFSLLAKRLGWLFRGELWKNEPRLVGLTIRLVSVPRGSRERTIFKFTREGAPWQNWIR